MDQMTDLQMPMPGELAAHLAHAANSNTHVPSHNLPPYEDMIIAAIGALKDKDGSSRQAIAKYIEQVYPNLPQTHPTLLTNSLKQMKNNGQLLMVKHSYALPRSETFSFAGDFSTSPATATADGSFSGIKRKPGRPPKAQSIQMGAPEPGFGAEPQGYSVSPAATGYTPEFQPYSMGAPGFGADVQSYQMGAPGYGSDVQAYQVGAPEPGHEVQHYPGGGPEPMFVSLGLEDGPVAATAPTLPSSVPESSPVTVTKRGRGRPPKGSSPSGPAPLSTVASGGPATLGKRARGRPVKPPRSITEIMSNGGLKPKKGRGRPRLNEPVIVPLAGGSPRPKSGPTYSGKPRGRPRKIGGAGVMVPIEGVAARRPAGRPVRVGVARKLSGKSVGRPRKNSGVTAVIVTDPQQLVAYQELKSKYENIQLKVKQAASLLRPCLNHEDAISALGALQELEALASSGEVNNAPVNTQSQEPPQQPLHDHQENLF